MYDYIITGGGPAGCVLARRLSDDPTIRVLLVEAGGRDWHPFIHMPAGFAKMTKGIASWGWSTVPQRHLNGRVLWYTQAKILGGGSSINAQIYTRGNARDYDAWAREDGCAGWSYREVLPYFKRAENNERFANDYHAYGGPLGVSNPAGSIRGKNNWRFEGDRTNPYVQEHTDLINSIRAGTPLNEGRQIAESTLTATMRSSRVSRAR